MTYFYGQSCFLKRGMPNLSYCSSTTIPMLIIKSCAVAVLLYGVPILPVQQMWHKQNNASLLILTAVLRNMEDFSVYDSSYFTSVTFQPLVIWNYIGILYRLLVPAKAQDTNLFKCYQSGSLLRVTLPYKN